MAHPLITLKAKSSSGDADFHTVVFHWKDGRLDVRCDCRASAFSLLCKHKMAFLCQDASMLFDPGQAPKLRDAAEWVKKASYGDAIEQIRALESGVEEAKDRLDKRRQELERELEKEVEEAKSKLHDEKMRFAYSLVGKTYEPSPPKQRKPRRELFPEPQDAVDDDDDGEDGFFSIVIGGDQEPDLDGDEIQPEPEAEEDSIESRAAKDARNRVMVASFVDGYAIGWRFAVPEAFKDALDIVRPPRRVSLVFKMNPHSKNIRDMLEKTEKRRFEEIWTQGKRYRFFAGSVMYDTRLAYDLPWEEALEHIRLAVQVVSADPSKPVLGQLKVKKMEKPISIVRFKHGKVVFNLLRPEKTKKGLSLETVITDIETDQEEFIAFLQSGMIRLKMKDPQSQKKTLQSKALDLFELFARPLD